MGHEPVGRISKAYSAISFRDHAAQYATLLRRTAPWSFGLEGTNLRGLSPPPLARRQGAAYSGASSHGSNPAGQTGVGNGEKDAQESRCESGEDIKSLNQEQRRQDEKRDDEKTAQSRGAEKIQTCCEEKAYCEKNTGPQKSPQAAAGEFRGEDRGRIHRDCRHADGRRAAAP